MRKIDNFSLISFEKHALDEFCTEVEQRIISTMNGKDTRMHARFRKCLKAYKAELARCIEMCTDNETCVESHEFVTAKVDLDEAYELLVDRINNLMMTKRDPEYRALAAQLNELITMTRVKNKAK